MEDQPEQKIKKKSLEFEHKQSAKQKTIDLRKIIPEKGS